MIPRTILILLVSLPVVAMAQTAPKPSAGDAYEARYMLAGYLLRAGNACPTESKRTIDAAFSLLGSHDLKAVSKAFPGTTEKWMTAGATAFNSEVMKSGIGDACARAMADRRRFEEAVNPGAAR